MSATATVTEEVLYDVRFRVFGANPVPAWQASICSTVVVRASSPEAAIEAAKVRVPTLTDADIAGVGVR